MGGGIPKGRYLNMYLPKSVLNVHSLALWSSSFICQYPDVASRTENTLAFGMRARTSSMVCMGYCTLLIALFGPRQMRRLLFGFLAVTMLLTHFVGSCTLLIMSSCSILFSSSFTLLRSATGTQRGGCITGVCLGSIFMLCSTWLMHPRPVKTSSYCSSRASVVLVMASIRCTRLISTLELRPNMFCPLSTTSNSTGVYSFLCWHRMCALP